VASTKKLWPKESEISGKVIGTLKELRRGNIERGNIQRRGTRTITVTISQTRRISPLQQALPR
jgi:hypothetical protein